MKFVRRLGLVLATMAFGFWLFWLVATASLVQTVGQPSVVKGWLTKSGVYSQVVPAIIEQNSKPGQDTNQLSTSGTISLSDPVVQKIAEGVFTPAFVQTSSESVINGTYGWLEGKTNTPQFDINLAAVKAKFAAGVGDYLHSRVAALPVCKTRPTQFDVMTATCLPRGVDTNAAIAQTVQEINSNKDFLPDAQLTANNLKTDQNGQKQPYYQHYANLPRLYRWLRVAPWIFGGLALATGLGIIFLNDKRRQGLRRVMVSLFTTGGLLLVYVWLLSYGLNRAQDQLIKNSGTKLDALKASLITSMRLAQHDINRIVVIFGLGFVAIGLGLAAYLILTREKQPKAPKPTEQTHYKRDEAETPSTPSKTER